MSVNVYFSWRHDQTKKEKKTDRDSRIKSESYRDRKIESKLQ